MKDLYLEKILEIHKSFCLITGLNSIIIDKNGEILSAQSPSYTFCNKFISLNKNNINVCKGCELKKIDINTENIHERCCFPFWSCNVPIKVNGGTVAKIFIGEALSDKLNDNELMRLSRQCKIEFTDIKNGINNTPILVDEQKNEVVHLLQNISGMVSRHYSETEKYREDVTRLRMLDKIARNINSPTHLYTIYDTIYWLTPKLIPFDTFCILLFDEKEDEFKVDYAQGVGADILRTAEFRKGEGYAGWVLREKKELIINDATMDSPVPIKYKRLTVEAGLVSYFVAPLQIDDKTVGCFIIASREKNKYSEHQIETINTFACWAAIAINKNDLIAKKNKMLENKQRVLENYLPHFFESPIDLFGIKIKNIITPEIEYSYEYVRELLREVLFNAKYYLLLDEYEIISPRLERTELIEFLTDIINNALKGHIKYNNISAILEISPSNIQNIYIWADRDKLFYIFFNLITNAIKFGNDGAHVIIKLEKLDNSLVINIIDEGLGIIENDKKKIFEPFERGTRHNNIVGGGLGLYIVNRLISAHKWNPLNIENNKINGCTVSFSIPNPEKCPYEILVIDDEAFVRNNVRNHLNELHYTVVLHNDIPNAETYIRDNYDKIKLIIIDAMGNDAGINAARDWNNKYGYKIILISQRLHFRDTLAGFPFIKKPIDKRRLLNTVEQELYRT